MDLTQTDVLFTASRDFGEADIITIWIETEEEGHKILCKINRNDIPQLIETLQSEVY